MALLDEPRSRGHARLLILASVAGYCYQHVDCVYRHRPPSRDKRVGCRPQRRLDFPVTVSRRWRYKSEMGITAKGPPQEGTSCEWRLTTVVDRRDSTDF